MDSGGRANQSVTMAYPLERNETCKLYRSLRKEDKRRRGELLRRWSHFRRSRRTTVLLRVRWKTPKPPTHPRSHERPTRLVTWHGRSSSIYVSGLFFQRRLLGLVGNTRYSPSIGVQDIWYIELQGIFRFWMACPCVSCIVYIFILFLVSAAVRLAYY